MNQRTYLCAIGFHLYHRRTVLATSVAVCRYIYRLCDAAQFRHF